MLIQRVRNDGRWQWHVAIDETRSGHILVTAGAWDLLIVGSHGPELPQLLVSSLSRMSLSIEGLKRARAQDDGHYALLYVNRTDDEVYICSDPYAIAKLYAWSAGGRFIIGTDLPAVLRSISASPVDLDENACGYYFMRGYLPARHTFHRDIVKVPPATIWRIVEGKMEESSYVNLLSPPNLSNNEYVVETARVYRSSIASYLEQFSAPVVALSGGIDSTLLLATFAKLGSGAADIVARTGVVLGGKSSIVLNPYDREFSRRVAKDMRLNHEEVYYDLNSPNLLNHLIQAITALGTECHVGATMFRSLGGETVPSGGALFAAQNADSIFSFAATGWPRLKKSWPPRIVGLGGWCTRCNLFGGFDRLGGLDTKIARVIFDRFLRKRFGVSWPRLRLADRVVGLAFEGQKWPVHPSAADYPHVRDIAGVVDWFLEQYWGARLSACFKECPHGAFMHVFLHNYMQGSANRGTAWYSTMTGLPTFLPFASLPILRLTARLQPDYKNYWFGKLPVLRMAESEYALPDYVRERSDPSTPELDNLYCETIMANKSVASHFRELLCDNAAAVDRLKAVLVPDWLDSVTNRAKEHSLKGPEATWATRLFWLLEIEHQAWGQDK